MIKILLVITLLLTIMMSAVNLYFVYIGTATMLNFIVIALCLLAFVLNLIEYIKD